MGKWLLFLLGMVLTGPWACAEAPDTLYAWPFEFTLQTGSEVHWICPTPMDGQYPRYYQRIDYVYVLEAYISGAWTSLGEFAAPLFTETWGHCFADKVARSGYTGWSPPLAASGVSGEFTY